MVTTIITAHCRITGTCTFYIVGGRTPLYLFQLSVIISLVYHQLDTQNSYLFTYNTFIKI
jgi:hypothetical protein